MKWINLYSTVFHFMNTSGICIASNLLSTLLDCLKVLDGKIIVAFTPEVGMIDKCCFRSRILNSECYS